MHRLLFVIMFPACGAPATPEPHPSEGSLASLAEIAPSSSAAPAAPGSSSPDPTEFDATDLVVGTGAQAELGSRVSVHYVGKLLDGTVFDETGHRPYEFTLGQGDVIPGWDRGIVHMRVGGKRRLVVPPDLAYGARGRPPKIPPNATLIFEIDLVEIL